MCQYVMQYFKLWAIVRQKRAGIRSGWSCHARRLHISGRYIFIQNDCQSGLYGLEKGSKSPVIQYASVNTAKSAIEDGGFPQFLHVCGKKLIEEGTGDGSRKHAEALQGPAC